MTHSGEACRIVEETISKAGVHFSLSLKCPLKVLRTSSDLRCLCNLKKIMCRLQDKKQRKHIKDR